MGQHATASQINRPSSQGPALRVFKTAAYQGSTQLYAQASVQAPWGQQAYAASDGHRRPRAQNAMPDGPRSRQTQLVWRVPAPKGPRKATEGECRVLTSLIKNCRTWQSLYQLWDENGAFMNHIHVSASITHLAQMLAPASRSGRAGSGRNSSGSLDPAAGSSSSSSSDSTDPGIRRSLFGSNSTSPGAGTRDDVLSTGQAAGGATATGEWPGDPRSMPGGLRSSASSNGTPPPSHQHTAWAAPGLSAGATPLPHRPGAVAAGTVSSREPSPHPPSGFRAPTLPRLLAFLTAAAERAATRFESRQLANTLWAVARLECAPSREWVDSMLRLAQPQLQQFEPQHLSNTLHALYLLRHRPPVNWHRDFLAAAYRRLFHFRPQELANLLHALARMAPPLPGKTFTHAAAIAVERNMCQFNAQELANASWALLRLGHQPSDRWITWFHYAAFMQLPHFHPPGLACIALVTGKLPLRPTPAWAKAVFAIAHPQLQYYTPQELTNLLSGMLHAEARPDVAFLSRWWDVATPRLPDFTSQNLAMLLWCLGRLRHCYRCERRVMALVLFYVSRQLSSFKPQELALTLGALGRLRLRPQSDWLERLVVEAYGKLGDMKAQELSVVLCTLGLLQHRPSPTWMFAYFTAAHARLRDFTPQGLANMAVGLGRLGHRPPRGWLPGFMAVLEWHLPSIGGYDLVSVLWALAVLDIAPPPIWLRTAVARLTAQAHTLRSTNVAHAVWALARFSQSRGGAGSVSEPMAVAAQEERGGATTEPGSGGGCAAPSGHTQSAVGTTAVAAVPSRNSSRGAAGAPAHGEAAAPPTALHAQRNSNGTGEEGAAFTDSKATAAGSDGRRGTASGPSNERMASTSGKLAHEGAAADGGGGTSSRTHTWDERDTLEQCIRTLLALSVSKTGRGDVAGRQQQQLFPATRDGAGVAVSSTAAMPLTVTKSDYHEQWSPPTAQASTVASGPPELYTQVRTVQEPSQSRSAGVGSSSRRHDAHEWPPTASRQPTASSSQHAEGKADNRNIRADLSESEHAFTGDVGAGRGSAGAGDLGEAGPGPGSALRQGTDPEGVVEGQSQVSPAPVGSRIDFGPLILQGMASWALTRLRARSGAEGAGVEQQWRHAAMGGGDDGLGAGRSSSLADRQAVA